MNIRHRQCPAIMPGLLMLALLAPVTVSAALIADGNYIMTIAETPGGGQPIFGAPGSWNSGFFFGCLPGTSGCGQAMSNNAVLVNGNGSSDGADGHAGIIGLTFSGGIATITSFTVDAIFNTAGGTLVQYGVLPSATGAVDNAGNMVLTPTGRLAATSDPAPGITDARWNVDDFTTPTNTAWTPFTSGTACNSLGCITGNEVVRVTPTTLRVTLVSAGYLGTDWGASAGTPYFEIWNSQSTIFWVSDLASVPVPAAAWLFGSGLLGLIGIAWRKVV